MTYEMKEIWGHPQKARQPVGAEAETRVTQGKPRHGGRGVLAAGNASSRGGPLCAGGARPHAPLHASGSRALRPRGGGRSQPPAPCQCFRQPRRLAWARPGQPRRERPPLLSAAQPPCCPRGRPRAGARGGGRRRTVPPPPPPQPRLSECPAGRCPRSLPPLPGPLSTVRLLQAPTPRPKGQPLPAGPRAATPAATSFAGLPFLPGRPCLPGRTGEHLGGGESGDSTSVTGMRVSQVSAGLSPHQPVATSGVRDTVWVPATC